jgi:mannitol/fructose-specific phosphotransferase system IIA component (Ntr-type)
MRISEFLNSSNVFPSLKVTNKEDAIRFLAESIASRHPEADPDALLRAVMERERVMSTGVGKGLAIPHGKVNGLESSQMAYAKLETPIEYGSIDQLPVSQLFLVVGPESQSSTHIRLLSRISRLMNNDGFRLELLECATTDEILAKFQSEELKMV